MKKITILLTAVVLIILSSITVFAGTWEQDANGKKYKLGHECGSDLEGKYVGYGGKEIDGSMYFFNKGYMQINCWGPTEDGRWRYYGSDGKNLISATTPDGYKIDREGYLEDSDGNRVYDNDASAQYKAGVEASGGRFIDAVGANSTSATSNSTETTSNNQQDNNAQTQQVTGEWKWIDSNGDGVSECYYYVNGSPLKNTTTPDGYQVNADGQWVVNGVVQTQNGNTTNVNENNETRNSASGMTIKEFVNFFNRGSSDSIIFYYDESNGAFYYDVYFPIVSKTDSDYQTKVNIIKKFYQNDSSTQGIANCCALQTGRNAKLYVTAYDNEEEEIYSTIYTGNLQDGAKDFEKFKRGEFNSSQVVTANASKSNSNETAWQNYAHDQTAKSSDSVRFSFNGHTMYIDYYLTGGSGSMSIAAAKAAAATQLNREYKENRTLARNMSSDFGFKITIVHRIFYNGELVGSRTCN